MFHIQLDKEDDGRWLAEVAEIPGAMAYGNSRQEAYASAAALALRVVAERIEHGEPVPAEARELFAAA